MNYRILKIKHTEGNTYYYPQYSNHWPWVWDYFDLRCVYPNQVIKFNNLDDAVNFIQQQVEPNLTLPDPDCFRVNDYLKKLLSPADKSLNKDKQEEKLKEQQENYPVGVTKEGSIEYEVISLD